MRPRFQFWQGRRGGARASEMEEAEAEPGAPGRPAPVSMADAVHHCYDDSVFVDGVYIVKGSPGLCCV
ncbi:hypothetical protein ACFSHQ_27090 [Gemmobacter lanyuensis]